MIGGYAAERLLRAPCAGLLYGLRQIGDQVQPGETVALVKEGEISTSIIAAIPGILRGLVRDELPVFAGMKVGDIDPRAAREHCLTISDKSRAIGGGVLYRCICTTNSTCLPNINSFIVACRCQELSIRRPG